MNKYENVLDFLENYYKNILTENEPLTYGLKVLSELVEKEKPKELLCDNLCPKCNLIVNSDYRKNGHMNYCPRCGQKLDL